MKSHHRLKLHAEYFEDVKDGRKTFETRFNDRDYKVGDVVSLKEGIHTLDGYQYSGREISAEIGYISDFGVNDGYVTFSLIRVGILIIGETND